MIQLLSLLFFSLAFSKVDKTISEVYIGEKRLDSYSGTYQPLIYQDLYQGKMTFSDDIFFQNYFQEYLFSEERNFSLFLKSELPGAILCSNELLSEHFEEMRYDYRLVSLSYLLEGQWHLNLMSEHLKLKGGCAFKLSDWLETCRPKGEDMKRFVSNLKEYTPAYEESFPAEYRESQWMDDKKNKTYKWYSHYRVKNTANLNKGFKDVCEDNQKLMTLLCSEEDHVFGLSRHLEAYSLLSRSNIINGMNKKSEAQGCLRRFSEVMSSKEVSYKALNDLFPSIQSFLTTKYEDRFPQGRVFFYGAAKEFEAKGLKSVFVKPQPLKIEKIVKEAPVEEIKPLPEKPKNPEVVAIPEPPKPELKKEIVEVKAVPKSAFLQAAEVRAQSDLRQVDVDMTKLKYDYVFTLNTINTLSPRLKTFMKREALYEMMNFDKLGTKEGAVPLLFIKYMIDMEEHQGLWNVISVVGDKFFVSNEIDSTYTTNPEFIQLLNNDATNRQWQIVILKP